MVADTRAALVTGAGSGIGAACARALSASDAAVAVVDIDAEAAAAVARGIADAGGTAHGIGCDVRRAADVEAAVSECVARFGGLDVVVNCAGIVRYATLPDTDEDSWHAVIDTNLTSVYLTTRFAVSHLRRRPGAAIVNVASAQAFASQPLVASYVASKAAMVAMTRSMAVDHAVDGIRVTAVAPGSVRTAMLEDSAARSPGGATEATFEEWGRQHLIGRIIEPDEVAAAVCFLASPAAAAITGTTLLVDGGLTARLGV